jgi:uncharacterized membrane protein
MCDAVADLTDKSVSAIRKERTEIHRDSILYGLKASCMQLTSYCLSIYGSTYIFVGPLPLFQFLNSIHCWYDSLDERSARRKAATYTQNNTNTE